MAKIKVLSIVGPGRSGTTVLAGILGAVLAAGLPAGEAAAVAAHLHGRCGQLAAADGPLIAGDLVRVLPRAVARLRGGADPAGPAGRLGA